MIKNWKLIIMHLMSYAEDNTNRAEDRAKARGIITKIRQYKFMYFCHFVSDLLGEVAKISLLFQREDINVSSAVTKLEAAHLSINEMLNNNGTYLNDFDVVGDTFRDHTLLNLVPLASLNRERRSIVQDILDCISSRFEDIYKDPVYVSCHVFDHKNWPDRNDGEALLEYGRKDVEVIWNHFNLLLTSCNAVLADALREWTELKLYVTRNQHFRTVHPLAVWQRVSQEDVNRNDYLNIMSLIHLTSLYPLSNASCERGFSNMKRIKSDWRCNLNTDTLDMLLRIDIEGPKINDFIPRPFVNRWWLSGQRSKRPTIAPYGPNQ